MSRSEWWPGVDRRGYIGTHMRGWPRYKITLGAVGAIGIGQRHSAMSSSDGSQAAGRANGTVMEIRDFQGRWITGFPQHVIYPPSVLHMLAGLASSKTGRNSQ